MSNLKKLAISVGDLNGIGIEIILDAHQEIIKLCQPIYCINRTLLEQSADLLKRAIPADIELSAVDGDFIIQAGTVDRNSGAYSFRSFLAAIHLAEDKEAWHLAGIEFKGHTDYLRHHFNQEAIMMLGCDELFVALFTEHIPLKDVVSTLNVESLKEFLINLYQATHFPHVGVLGLNPHAGDGGVLGNEEDIIIHAIHEANQELKQTIFHGPLVPDTAFTPLALKSSNRLVAMYHDQGLAPLKALYFDQSINVSLHLPIRRTSVDHGTAFDISYQNKKPQITSYINAIKAAISSS